MISMDSSTRAEMIRKGNQAFNEGKYPEARELFTKADYKDGLVRLGDYYMFDRRLPLLAYGYYKRAGAMRKIEEIQKRMVLALGEWIGRDKIKPESLQRLESGFAPDMTTDREGMVSVPVSPFLKDAALKILAKK
ncbi:MAG TPA: hypothetical protein PKE49_08090 [Leptospiraceae bacterium]|mgnify:CR=1 FL=1|jgi:hypothetical protein|nr:hypothetical protein [Leptospiraceae bacterium]HMX56470.1 hypothetical protein [Leptospiraceae bacterium]HNL02366.1 hypothetical protein [Leptospiraceae bacterium]HNL69150.1 hypothetical protein [Leptospiraceae bacterium]HNN58718.1 hypothetical protein [Leptospiraceae bacterium]